MREGDNVSDALHINEAGPNLTAADLEKLQ